MRTEDTNHLRSLLNQHTPLSVIKPEYASVLRGKTVTVDGSNQWITNTILAEFMLSPERKAIDKHQQYMASPVERTNGDGEYDEKDSRWKD